MAYKLNLNCNIPRNIFIDLKYIVSHMLCPIFILVDILYAKGKMLQIPVGRFHRVEVARIKQMNQILQLFFVGKMRNVQYILSN